MGKMKTTGTAELQREKNFNSQRLILRRFCASHPIACKNDRSS